MSFNSKLKKMKIYLTLYRYNGPLSSVEDFFNHPFAKGTSEVSKIEKRSANTLKAVSGLVRSGDLIDTTPEAAAKASNSPTSPPPRSSHTEDLLGLDITASETLAQPIKASAINERPKSGAQNKLLEMVNTLLGEAQKSPQMAEQLLKTLMPIHQERTASGQTPVQSSSAATTNTSKPQAGNLSVIVTDKNQKLADDTRATETNKFGTIFGEHISRTRFIHRDSAVSTAPPLSPRISSVAEKSQNLNLNEAIAPVSLT